MLQFITNTKSPVPVETQVASALQGGCRWIQLRMKDADADEIRRVVGLIKPMCDRAEAFLILNDHVELAKELEVTGVHIGKEDMSPTEARIILGAGAVIGVTVNSYEDVLRVSECDIDYLGVGPFRYTTTKEKLAPVLGIDGVREICRRMKEDGIEIATVAVGGIEAADIPELLAAGINGVAVSGAIANSADIVEQTRSFIDMLDSAAGK